MNWGTLLFICILQRKKVFDCVLICKLSITNCLPLLVIIDCICILINTNGKYYDVVEMSWWCWWRYCDHDDNEVTYNVYIEMRKRWYVHLAHIHSSYPFGCTFVLICGDEPCWWIWLSVKCVIVRLYSSWSEVLYMWWVVFNYKLCLDC